MRSQSSRAGKLVYGCLSSFLLLQRYMLLRRWLLRRRLPRCKNLQHALVHGMASRRVKRQRQAWRARNAQGRTPHVHTHSRVDERVIGSAHLDRPPPGSTGGTMPLGSLPLAPGGGGGSAVGKRMNGGRPALEAVDASDAGATATVAPGKGPGGSMPAAGAPPLWAENTPCGCMVKCGGAGTEACACEAAKGNGIAPGVVVEMAEGGKGSVPGAPEGVAAVKCAALEGWGGGAAALAEPLSRGAEAEGSEVRTGAALPGAESANGAPGASGGA